MNKFLERLVRFEKALAAILIGLLSLLVVLDVCSREFLNLGLPWAQKAAVYMMIWAGFLGAVLITHKAEHLRPQIADKLWKGKLKKVYLRLQHFLTAIFSFTLFYYSYLYVHESYGYADKNIVLDVPMWFLQIIIPYCFLSMGLRNIYHIFSPIEPSGSLH